MKALVYRGPGKKQLEDMPKPAVREATDAVPGFITRYINPLDGV